MKALLTKRRIAVWTAVPAMLAGFIVMITAGLASAHTGTLGVTPSCVDGSTVLTFSGQTSNVPTSGAGHTATMTVGEIMPSGTAITNVVVNNQATTLPATVVGNVSYSFKMTVPGTTTYAQATAFLAWGDGVKSDPIGKITLPGNCTKSAAPAAYTTTPETCTSNGSVSIPAQPAGVVVKVNGNVVNMPWSTSTPGSYAVAYSAAPGYSLSGNPSGTAVVKAQLGVEHCTKPVVTGSASCSGIVVSGSNVGGQVPATFIVTRPNGTTETITVPAGGTFTRTYPVIEDATATVKVTAAGMQDFVLSYTANCVPPPAPPQAGPPTASVNATCVTRRYGEGVAQLQNPGSTSTRFLIKGVHLHKVVWVAPGTSRTVNLHGLKVRTVVKVVVHHKVIARDRVELRPACHPAPPSHTGMRTSSAPA